MRAAGCRREAECEFLPVVLSESSCFAYRKFVGAKKTNYFCTAFRMHERRARVMSSFADCLVLSRQSITSNNFISLYGHLQDQKGITPAIGR